VILPHRIGPPSMLWNGGSKMATKRHKPEEIVAKLRQVDVLVGQGRPRIDAIRQVQITEHTYYRWRKQYGGMGTDQLKELKRLQRENERLRRAVSDLTLDKLILAEAAKGNF
jgi:putative transposase